MQVFDAQLIESLIIASLAGGLLGIEREMGKKVVAGTRTFMLTSLMGALSVNISQTLGSELFLVWVTLGMFLIALFIGVVKNFLVEDIGITTLVAYVLAFAIGVLIGAGFPLQGVAASILVAVILAGKRYSRALSKAMSFREMTNALEFGIVAFVLYPLLPDEAIDPYGLISPRTLVFVVIVVSTIGFAGFLALRWFGAELALPVTGALGALVNSQATVGALASRVKEETLLEKPALQGILLASGVALFRSLLIAALLSQAVGKEMLLPMVGMALVSVLPVRFKFEREALQGKRLEVSLPFALVPALKFALLFTAITALAKLAQSYGGLGLYPTAFFAGFVSSGAVVASFASLAAKGELSASIAANCAVLSAIASVLSKIVLVKASGTPPLAAKVMRYYSLAIAAGVALILLKTYLPPS
ncbi:MgtC/SapB family protein [Candidatus Pyrohabitans sp.]